ncbi:MAG: sulfite exporter TauE/SafE family protein [Rhizobiaceae bacterium]
MLTVSIETAIFLFTASVLAGALNAVAGGATFFTFPVLVWSGLTPLVANVTNMVALFPANVAALPAYRNQLRALGKKIWPPLMIGVIGGTIGAVALLYLGGNLFAALVPYLMGLATLLFATAPALRRLVVRSQRDTGGRGSWAPVAILFVFSLYGGYFGAGLGQIVLAALILNGHEDFHEANALKNGVVSAISLMAVLVYVFSGAVSWPHAAIMVIGATAGGYFGATLSQAVPQYILRILVIAFGVFLTIYYFLEGA